MSQDLNLMGGFNSEMKTANANTTINKSTYDPLKELHDLFLINDGHAINSNPNFNPNNNNNSLAKFNNIFDANSNINTNTSARLSTTLIPISLSNQKIPMGTDNRNLLDESS